MGVSMKHVGGADSKVVSLFQKAEQVKFPAVAQVEAYWEALRDGRLMPDRAEIDPRGLESALEYAFILEHIAPGVGRIRVAGMHMSDLLGMEVRGMPLTAMFAQGSRDTLSRVLQSVVSDPKVVDLSLVDIGGIGRPQLRAQLYLAPLASHTGCVPRVLGCLQAIGRIGRTPRRFTVEHVQMRRIAASKPAADPGKPPLPDSAFAEDAAPYSPPRGARPKLWLVKSEE